MPKKARQIEIEGNMFESISIAAEAYGIPRSTFMNRLRHKYVHRNSFTEKELQLDHLQPSIRNDQLVGVIPALTWEFVYNQIASSPIGRGVDSIHHSLAA